MAYGVVRNVQAPELCHPSAEAVLAQQLRGGGRTLDHSDLTAFLQQVAYVVCGRQPGRDAR